MNGTIHIIQDTKREPSPGNILEHNEDIYLYSNTRKPICSKTEHKLGVGLGGYIICLTMHNTNVIPAAPSFFSSPSGVAAAAAGSSFASSFLGPGAGFGTEQSVA